MRHAVSDHFVEYHEMVDIGSGAKREMDLEKAQTSLFEGQKE